MGLLDISADVLRQRGVRHLVTVANHETQGLRNRFENDAECQVVSACREGEAVAIACGLIAGGKLAVLAIENLGLFECLDTIRGLGCAMQVPLPIFVGYLGRGVGAEAAHAMVGGFASQVMTAGEWSEPILAATGIPYRVVLPDAGAAKARAAFSEAMDSKGPFAILVDHLNEE